MCNNLVREKEKAAINVLNGITCNNGAISKQSFMWSEFNSVDDQQRSVGQHRTTFEDICPWMSNQKHKVANCNNSMHLGGTYCGKAGSKRRNLTLAGNTFIHGLSHKQYVERYKAHYSPTGLQARKLYTSGLTAGLRQNQIDTNDDRQISLCSNSKQTLSNSSLGKLDTSTSTDENDNSATARSSTNDNRLINGKPRPMLIEDNYDEAGGEVFYTGDDATASVQAQTGQQQQGTNKSKTGKRDAMLYSCLPPVHIKTVSRDIGDFFIKPV